MSITYGLRADYADGYIGGVLAVEDGEAFDVGAELAAGGGTIEVDATDVVLVNALDAYPAVERIDVERTDKSAEDMTVAELREELARRGLPTDGVKADLLDRLTAGPSNPDAPEA